MHIHVSGFDDDLFSPETGCGNNSKIDGGKMNGRKNHYLELSRTGLYGCRRHRYGVFSDLDFRMIRGGMMREITIILIFLITAIIVWWPRKGKKK